MKLLNSIDSGKLFAIMGGRCVSGHVVRESLPAVRLGYVTEMH